MFRSAGVPFFPILFFFFSPKLRRSCTSTRTLLLHFPFYLLALRSCLPPCNNEGKQSKLSYGRTRIFHQHSQSKKTLQQHLMATNSELLSFLHGRRRRKGKNIAKVAPFARLIQRRTIFNNDILHVHVHSFAY